MRKEDHIRSSKVGIITLINKWLVERSGTQLSTEDFDLLYSMDMDELIGAQMEIDRDLEQQLKTNPPDNQ